MKLVFFVAKRTNTHKLLNRGSAATVRKLQTGRKIDKVARNGGTNLVGSHYGPEVAPDQVHEAISRHLIESSSGLKLLNRGSAATVRQLQTGREIDKVARNVGRNLVRQAPEVVRTGRDHGGGAERW